MFKPAEYCVVTSSFSFDILEKLFIYLPPYMIIELNIRNNVVGWKETETTGLQFDG